MNNKYTIYIPSKGRWESRLTVRALEEMNVPFFVVVEPAEYENYAAVIAPEKLITLPENNMKLIGSRCWIMEHSIAKGEERHWQIDDNIRCFYRWNHNRQIRAGGGAIFRAAEDFSDRYENVALSGFEYFMFAPRKRKLAPYRLNTRIYSCTLVNNKIPHRWRSIYNDDTDISLCALKDGWCTILFQAFLCHKMRTMTMKGGNTEELYLIEDGRLKMAQALVDLHPDVTTIYWRWGRWQHQVDYRKFKYNKLKKKEGLIVPEGINNYGMVIQEIENGQQVPEEIQPTEAKLPLAPVEVTNYFKEYYVNNKFIGLVVNCQKDREKLGYFGRQQEKITETVALSNGKKIKAGTNVLTILYETNL